MTDVDDNIIKSWNALLAFLDRYTFLPSFETAQRTPFLWKSFWFAHSIQSPPIHNHYEFLLSIKVSHNWIYVVRSTVKNLLSLQKIFLKVLWRKYLHHQFFKYLIRQICTHWNPSIFFSSPSLLNLIHATIYIISLNGKCAFYGWFNFKVM